MKKNSVTGWVGAVELEYLLDKISQPYPKEGCDKTLYVTLFKTKGQKEYWSDVDWPPKKITITFEDA